METSGRPHLTGRPSLPPVSASVLLVALLVIPAPAEGQNAPPADPAAAFPVDRAMIARIREEGLKRSQLANTLSYMTDVLGGRLTNSDAMDRAQRWVTGEMERIGLVNVEREPFMPYGASWDSGLSVARITAGNHVSQTGTARSAIPAVERCLVPFARDGRNHGVDWRDSWESSPDDNQCPGGMSGTFQKVKSSASLSPRLGCCPGSWLREASMPSLSSWLTPYRVPNDKERLRPWEERRV